MSENNTIKLIKEIGSRCSVSEADMNILLPNMPTLKGSEFIFSIGWANAKKYIDDEVQELVKGLHLVELKYREIYKNDFGFGSPSPTEKIIRALEKINKETAHELRIWIAESGGNYYITATDNK